MRLCIASAAAQNTSKQAVSAGTTSKRLISELETNYTGQGGENVTLPSKRLILQQKPWFEPLWKGTFVVG
jgi:hypothetical protein